MPTTKVPWIFIQVHGSLPQMGVSEHRDTHHYGVFIGWATILAKDISWPQGQEPIYGA
jgi:hypothetical protein